MVKQNTIDKMAKKKRKPKGKSGFAEFEWRSYGGAPGLEIAGVPIEHPAHAVTSAERWADQMAAEHAQAAVKPHAVMIIGAGLGHFPKAIRERSELPIAVWDCYPGVTEQAPMSEGWDDGIDVIHTTRQAMEWRLKQSEGRSTLAIDMAVNICKDPGKLKMLDIFRFEDSWFRNVVAQSNESEKVRYDTDPRTKEISTGALECLERLHIAGNFADLGNALRDVPAVCCSQGPSLDVEGVRQAQERGAAVIASVQSCRKLNEGGVRPDFLVLTDPSILVYEQLEGWEPDFGLLLCDTLADHRAIDRWPDKCVYFHMRSVHMHHIAWCALGRPYYWQPWLTVGETIQRIALDLGSNLIITSGIDYAADHKDKTNKLHVSTFAGKGWTNWHYYAGAKYSRWLVGASKDLAQRGRVIHWLRYSGGIHIHGADHLEPGTLGRDLPNLFPRLPRYEVPKVIKHDCKAFIDEMIPQLIKQANTHAPRYGKMTKQERQQSKKIPHHLRGKLRALSANERLQMLNGGAG